MKTKSLFIAALVVFSAAVSALGKEDPANLGLAVINVKGTEVYKIVYKGQAAGKVKLNVYNSADGKVVYSQVLNQVDGFILPLNFNGLSFGEYTVELIDANGKKLEKVNYLSQVKASNIHVSKVANEEGKYLVAVANEGAKVISVRVYDAAHNVVYDGTEEIFGDFAKVYTIKNFAAGFTLEVADSTGYTKTVNL
jgi:hypothetical protein